jgi:hypothetical protein
MTGERETNVKPKKYRTTNNMKKNQISAKRGDV